MVKVSGFFSRLKQAFTKPRKKVVNVSEQSISELEEQVRNHPGNFRLRLKLAEQYNLMGQHEKAIEELLKSARLYAENDFIPLAIATYKKILSEDPSHLEANLELARIYRQKGLYADATIHYRRVFDYYQENGITSKALETLETIIAIAPEKEPYRLLLKELFPEHQESARSIYSDIIISRKQKNEPEERESTAPESLDAPASEETFFDLGAELGSDLSKIDPEAISPNENVETRNDDDDLGIEKIFQTMKSTFQEEGGDTDPDKFHYNLALAYYELNMPEQALKESEDLLNSANFRLPALLLRSRIFLQQGSLSAALSQVQQGLLEKGLTRQDFLSLKLQLGLILKAMGHRLQALEAFHEAHAIDPDNPEILSEIQELEKDSEVIAS